MQKTVLSYYNKHNDWLQIVIFRSIKVGYTPNVLTEATAELCVSLLLATSRRIFEANQAAREGLWQTWEPYFVCGKQIRGSIIGFYGLGNVGLSVAEKLHTFKPKTIIYHNRNKREDGSVCFDNRFDNIFYLFSVDYTYVDFETLLKESDFLILTASSNSQNNEIFNSAAFEKMKRDSILINVGR